MELPAAGRNCAPATAFLTCFQPTGGVPRRSACWHEWMTVPKEVELKLGLEPGQVARLKRELARDPHIDTVNRIAALESEYFDTDQLDIHRAGMTLRLRDEGGRRVQTVKRDDGAGGGLFERAEWETEVDGDRLDLKAARVTRI